MTSSVDVTLKDGRREAGGHIGMHSYTHVCCNDFYTSWQHMRAMNVYFENLLGKRYEVKLKILKNNTCISTSDVIDYLLRAGMLELADRHD